MPVSTWLTACLWYWKIEPCRCVTTCTVLCGCVCGYVCVMLVGPWSADVWVSLFLHRHPLRMATGDPIAVT